MDYDNKLIGMNISTVMKCFSMFTVLSAHMGGFFNLVWGGKYKYIDVALCDVGMATFLFLSGYGMMSSYRKNGLGNYWDKRIKKVFFPAVLVNFFCIFIISFLRMDVFSREEAIEGLFMMNRDNYVNSPTWYINYLFVWYFLFWFINVIVHSNKLKIILHVSISLCMWYIVPAVYPASNYYVFSFTIGIVVAFMEECEITSKLLKKYSKEWIQVFAVIFFIVALLVYSVTWEAIKGRYPFRIQTIVGAFFVTYGILAMYIVAKNAFKIRIIGKVLSAIGEISFGIYLWHYPLMVETVRLFNESMVIARLFVVIIGFIACCFLARGINYLIERINI